MKILITGASGQLGIALTKLKLEKINLLLPKRYELDLKNANNCYEYTLENKPDWIINCGAYTSVDLAEENKETAFKINSDAPRAFAKALKITGGKIVQVSTDYVFNGLQNTPYKTTQEKNPTSAYGESKSMGEIALEEVLDNKKQFYIIRTSWLMSSTGKNFLLTMIDLLNKRKQISIVSDQIGSPTTTNTLAIAIWEIIRKDSFINMMFGNNLPILHWTDLGTASWYDIAIFIKEIGTKLGLIRNNIEIIPIKSNEYKTRAIRPKYSVLDCDSTRRLLNLNGIHWKKSLYEIISSIEILDK